MQCVEEYDNKDGTNYDTIEVKQEMLSRISQRPSSKKSKQLSEFNKIIKPYNLNYSRMVSSLECYINWMRNILISLIQCSVCQKAFACTMISEPNKRLHWKTQKGGHGKWSSALVLERALSEVGGTSSARQTIWNQEIDASSTLYLRVRCLLK